VKEDGLTEDEVERAKRYLIGNFEIGLQTNGAQANHISLDELYGMGYDYYQKYPRRFKRSQRKMCTGWPKIFQLRSLYARRYPAPS